MDLRDSEQELKQLVQAILQEAAGQGASAAEVAVSEDAGLSVSVRKGELETVEFNADKGFGITLYYGNRKGSASTSDSRVEAIRETVRAASQIARHTQEDTCNGLADASLMATDLPDLDLYHAWDMDPERAEAMALECESAGLNADSRISNSDGAQVSTHQTCRVYGNSHGFVGSYVGTRHGLSCVLIAEDAQGMERDYWYTSSRRPGELEPAAAIGAEAARRTVARLAPRKVTTGQFPVVFIAQIAGSLLGHLMGALSGGALYRKSSFLLDSMGKSVMPAGFSIFEDPHVLAGSGSAAFDGDGVATSRKSFIEEGRVASYLLSTYSARKLGLTTTGNAGGVHNLQISGPSDSLDGLLKTMGTGLLVHELLGQGVNMVTGDYSRGVSGFWVENGEVQYPVEGVTIAGNLKDMYQNIPVIGDDVDRRGNVLAPSILMESMMVAGGSDHGK